MIKSNVEFTVKIQSHGQSERLFIEIPKKIRGNFRVGSILKIIMREME